MRHLVRRLEAARAEGHEGPAVHSALVTRVARQLLAQLTVDLISEVNPTQVTVVW